MRKSPREKESGKEMRDRVRKKEEKKRKLKKRKKERRKKSINTFFKK